MPARAPRPPPPLLALGILASLAIPAPASGTPAPPSMCNGLEGGVYLDSAGICTYCPAGHGCPRGVAISQASLSQHACQPGTYQPLTGKMSCPPCPEDSFCPGSGLTSFQPCPVTGSAPQGSVSCLFCTNEAYFIVASNGSCAQRSTCVEGAQYEVLPRSRYSDTVCAALTPYTPTPITPTPPCVVGGAKLCEGVLVSYVRVAETPTSDRELWRWEPCLAGQYLRTRLVADTRGVIITPQECAWYTDCASQGMYRVVDGTRSEDRDNVCSTPRVCVQGEEYTVALHQEASAQNGYVGSDTVCAPYTLCNPATEYLAVRGNATSDNRCAPVEDCSQPLDARFELSPPVDAGEAYNSIGRNAVCKEYTLCGPGSYPNASGTRASDRECAPCPAGTYGTDGESCSPCQVGVEYSPNAGSTSCTACTACTGNGTAGEPGGAPQGVAEAGWGADRMCNSTGGVCPTAYRSLCTATADARCMSCPQPAWSLSPATGLCEACATGYLHRLPTANGSAGEAVGPGECTPCPEDFYCPNARSQRRCQGLVVYDGPSGDPRPHAVPWSPPASAFPSDCSCASTGGGFEGRADGLVGCTPCRDGHFSPPANRTVAPPAEARCEPCPAGTYASRRQAPDRIACPTDASSALLGEVGAPQQQQQQQACGGLDPPTVTVGASSCTPCPPDRPHTRSAASSSQADCTRCPAGQWWGGGRCNPCRGACSLAAGEFEASPCTDGADLACSTCVGASSCLTGERFVGCSASNPRGCEPCDGAPSVGAAYVEAGLGSCAWECLEGRYLRGASECAPCTVFNSTTCPAGMVLTPCSPDGLTGDASCDTPCDASLRPPFHSRWYSVYRNSEAGPGGGLVRDVSGLRPNEGCAWECEPGYVAIKTRGSGIDLCVEEGGAMAKRYGPRAP